MIPPSRPLTRRRSKALYFSTIILPFGTSIGSAAITVSQTPSFPAATAVETFETAPGIPGAMEIRDNRRGTQTFQVSTGFTIDRIYIGLDLSGGFNPAETFSVSIFTVTDTNTGAPSAVPSGTNLLTTTAEIVSLGTAGSGGFLELDLTGADEIYLAPTIGSAGYALQLNNTSSTSAFRWRLNQAGDGTGGGPVQPDAYTLGQAYGTPLGSGFTHGNSDYVVGFTAKPVPIPEPSTNLLFLFASSAVFLHRRRA